MYGGDLQHHGIKGMKWGVRRFQTKDGSLTPAGKKRYVTTAQAVRNANNAAKDARKKSMAESRATESGIGSYRRAANKASAAGAEAYRNSIAKDKAYNKQLREEKKASKLKEEELKKAAKQEYNDFVKTRSKEILAGESFVGKVWDVLTDAHKYQAQIEYNLRDKD